MRKNQIIEIENISDEEARALLGASDQNLAILCECLGLDISFRDHRFLVRECSNTQYEALKNILNSLYHMIEQNKAVHEQDIIYLCRSALKGENVDIDELSRHIVGRTLSGKIIYPKTQGQLAFVKSMEKNTVVFAIGPAGTGKTFLAVIQAVTALKKGDVKRIVLTRPAVEAGENLGFLPGDMKEKVDPYLTPLYDALNDMLGNEQTQKFIDKGVIEIAPLAYMRGRTLDDSYVILDEAQNTTSAQMKMFLTRLGFRSHMVITGDVTQIDLKANVRSGLIEATRILKGIDGIDILELSADDVVRHPLVQKMIERYGEMEKR